MSLSSLSQQNHSTPVHSKLNLKYVGATTRTQTTGLNSAGQSGSLVHQQKQIWTRWACFWHLIQIFSHCDTTFLHCTMTYASELVRHCTCSLSTKQCNHVWKNQHFLSTAMLVAMDSATQLDSRSTSMQQTVNPVVSQTIELFSFQNQRLLQYSTSKHASFQMK